MSVVGQLNTSIGKLLEKQISSTHTWKQELLLEGSQSMDETSVNLCLPTTERVSSSIKN